MTTTALLISLILQAQAAGPPSLQYSQRTFQIQARGHVESFSIVPIAPAVPKFTAFRRNESFAVWDDRGLTVRRGDRSLSTRLPEVPVSSRIFHRDEVLKTIDRIRSGQYVKDAAGLSGARRLGKDAFFLVRWEDTDHKPWAEALVQVDLTVDGIQPQVLGRFAGLSTASLPIDDKLLILDGKLAIVEHSADSWGVSTYDPATREFHTQQMGAHLASLQTMDVTQALFVENSGYGTSIAGRVDLTDGTRMILYEGYEKLRFLDVEAPTIVLASSPGRTKLVNCETGAIREIPYVVDAQRVGPGVLLWTTPGEPTGGWIMSPDTWQSLATWRAGS